jgi:starch synthase
VRVGLLTREFPPEVYGGAGVHVEHLAAALSALGTVDVDVHCMGVDRPTASAHRPDERLTDASSVLGVLSADLTMTAALEGVDLVHSHTWYVDLAGHLASLLFDVPHVLTTHSLEPSRPWKAEQLGGGYAVSSWIERAAVEAATRVIAVSNAMRDEVLATYPAVDPDRVVVVHNGIDTDVYRPDPSTDVLTARGVDPSRPYVLFIGRITRQKGVPHLLRAAGQLDREVQLVLCAGAADTPELAAEVQSLVDGLRTSRAGVHWIDEMVPRTEAIQLLTHAAVFVCPSVYEPLGIVNLEAMACSTPVVATAVGGIPEVVDDGVTGLLVACDDTVEDGLAAAVNALVREPERAAAMGAAGRKRVLAEFSWGAVAAATVDVYRAALLDHAR